MDEGLSRRLAEAGLKQAVTQSLVAHQFDGQQKKADRKRKRRGRRKQRGG